MWLNKYLKGEYLDTKEIVKLEELIPDWWGKTRV